MVTQKIVMFLLLKKEATIGELNFEFEGTVKMSVPVKTKETAKAILIYLNGFVPSVNGRVS